MTADVDSTTTDPTAAATNANAALAAQLEERLIQQEYKIWKKNTPFLYDFVMTHGLEWPSLTCQWLPTYKSLHDGQKVGAIGGTSLNVAEQHELLIGTHTTGEQNYLMVATVNLPREDAVIDNRANAAAATSAAAKSTGDEAATTATVDGEAAEAAAAQASKKVKTTIIDAPNPASNYNEEKNELGGYSAAAASASSSSSSSGNNVGKIDIKMKIPHEGEVNRARYMPQNHFVVATRGPGTDVYIWDLSKHPSFPSMTSTTTASSSTTSMTGGGGGEGGGGGNNTTFSAINAAIASSNITPNPNIICRGHTGEGYGVAWCGISGSHDNVGKLITSSEDKSVCLWDVKTALKECGSSSSSSTTTTGGGTSSMIVNPIAQFLYHTDVVEDVDWHNKDINMIGSCGDDKIICLWDVREGKRSKPMHVIEKAHDGDVNSMEFHPTNEFLLASGGSDKVVKLWDLRNLSSPLQTLEGHTDQVYTVHWSPFDESILASCSSDRRIALWDLSRIGMEQSPEDAEDGPPELLFLHGGHTSKVNDFSWNPNYEWCLGGVSEDNIMQIWCPAEDVYADGGGDDDDDEDEDGDLATKQRAEILGDDELE